MTARRLLRPLAIVLPPAWIVVVFFLCYLVAQGAVWFFEGMSLKFMGTIDLAIVEPMWRFRAGIATSGAALFAFWRVLAFHPIARWDYRQWLMQTPWTPGKPLVMGKVWPGGVDVLLVAFFCWLSGSDLEGALVAPVFGYLIALVAVTCLLAAFSRQRAAGYLLLFGVGLALRVAYNLTLPLVVLAAMLPIVYFALRRSLEPARWPNFPLSLQKYQERQRQQSWMLLGWPFGFVGPRASPRYLRRMDALAIALLLGWFVQSGLVVAQLNQQDERAVAAVGTMLICLGAVIRAVGFCVTYWSPISLAGRLLTLRWIIPKYDKALVAPLAAIMMLLAGQLVTVKLDVPAYVGQPVVVALCALVLLGVGPSVRDWELTGGHRITPLPYCTKGSQFVRV